MFCSQSEKKNRGEGSKIANWQGGGGFEPGTFKSKVPADYSLGHGGISAILIVPDY